MPETMPWRTGLFSMLLLMACTKTPAQTDAAMDFAQINSALLETADTALSQSLIANKQIPSTQRSHADSQPERQRLNPVHARIQQLEPIIVPILEQHGIPAGLTAIVAVESGGNLRALSPKGARGLWQLMPQTARRYGLIVDNVRDDRIDVKKSTAAAAQYLADLYTQFGSWPMALAAYNRGEQGLTEAIRRAHSTDLSLLFASGRLPAETRAYVPAVLARWSVSTDHVAQKFVPVGTVIYAHAQEMELQPSELSVSHATAGTELTSITN